LIVKNRCILSGKCKRGPCQAVEVPIGSEVPDAFQALILVKFISLMCRDATNNAQNYSKIDK
jgi:hypothetical protein